MVALDKDIIRIGLPIPFHDNYSINNVGIIILEYSKNITIYQLSELIKNKMNLVYTSNIYNLYGKKISSITGLDNYTGRQKVGFTIREFCLQPKEPLYEGAYMSIYTDR